MQARFHSSIQSCIPGLVKRVDLWVLCMVLCVPAARAASLPHPHRQPRQIVRTIERLEARWQHAELTGDTTVMAQMLADDYLGIYGDGTLATRSETLASVRKGTTRFSSIDTFDRKIRVFGSTVVVTSKARVKGVHDGENLSGLYRYTRVYHRHNDVWKIVSFEASTIHPGATVGPEPDNALEPGSKPHTTSPPEP